MLKKANMVVRLTINAFDQSKCIWLWCIRNALLL